MSWVFASGVHSLAMLYLTYGALGGIGTGIIYIGVIGVVVRWFPDRRGFVTGIAAAGYGMGAILTTFPIAQMIDSSGYRNTLLVFGIIQGIVGFAAAQGLKRPPDQQGGTDVAVAQSVHSYSPRQMLRTAPFWVMFAMMACMSTSGLMVTAQVGEFAKDFGVADTVVLGMAALTLSLTLSRFTNGLSRPFFGWISDHIGREPTMCLAFCLEAVGVLTLLAFRENAVLFVLLTGIVFLGWGEIFSLFPSTLTDIYGPVHATTNYGFLYIAQGIGALLGGPAAAWLMVTTGSWTPVFILVAVIDAGVGLCAIVILRPMHLRWTARDRTRVATAGASLLATDPAPASGPVPAGPSEAEPRL
jgi:oxalate/formate antiporter